MARSPKNLSDDDRVIWHRVARTVERRKPIVEDMPEDIEMGAQNVPPKTFPRQPKSPIISKTKPTKPTKGPVISGPEDRATSPNMDRRNFQRLVRGKLDIDASIDLHGLTASQAHTRLRAFVNDAHRGGCRLVLVITGKGTRSHSDEFGRQRSGVIRSSLPDWIRSVELSDKVLQVTPAQRKHGGEGAFYVYLRRVR